MSLIGGITLIILASCGTTRQNVNLLVEPSEINYRCFKQLNEDIICRKITD